MDVATAPYSVLMSQKYTDCGLSSRSITCLAPSSLTQRLSAADGTSALMTYERQRTSGHQHVTGGGQLRSVNAE